MTSNMTRCKDLQIVTSNCRGTCWPRWITISIILSGLQHSWMHSWLILGMRLIAPTSLPVRNIQRFLLGYACWSRLTNIQEEEESWQCWIVELVLGITLIASTSSPGSNKQLQLPRRIAHCHTSKHNYSLMLCTWLIYTTNTLIASFSPNKSCFKEVSNFMHWVRTLNVFCGWPH